DIDVLLLARYSDRRARILAGMARALVGRRTHLLLLEERDDAPRDLGALLARSRVALHIHDAAWQSFPWWLWLHAAATGAALVTERSSDADPVRPMLEFASGGERSLGLLTTALLDDDAWRAELVRASARRASSLPPLEQAVQAL